jgi:hypothetical protein
MIYLVPHWKRPTTSLFIALLIDSSSLLFPISLQEPL